MSDANAQWFYAVGQEQKGPVSADQLRALLASGAIGRDTLVWNSSMSEWTPLGHTAFVGAGPSSFAPPPPPHPGYATPAGYGAPGGAYAAAPPSPNFQQAISLCFAKYATFAGRATRPEYWWFYLFTFLLTQGLAVIEAVVGSPGILSGLASLAVLVPMLSAGARRLHDTDRSGWWQLLWFVPLVGWIVVIVFLCQRGTDGANRFG